MTERARLCHTAMSPPRQEGSEGCASHALPRARCAGLHLPRAQGKAQIALPGAGAWIYVEAQPSKPAPADTDIPGPVWFIQ